MIDKREMANAYADFVLDTSGPGPDVGMVCVVLAREAPRRPGDSSPRLAIDACVKCGGAMTEAGGLMLVDFARRMTATVEQLARDWAAERGLVLDRREDLEQTLAQATDGKRAKA